MSWGENVTRSAFEEFESLRFEEFRVPCSVFCVPGLKKFESLRFEEFRVSRSAFRVLFIGSIIYLKDKAVIR